MPSQISSPPVPPASEGTLLVQGGHVATPQESDATERRRATSSPTVFGSTTSAPDTERASSDLKLRHAYVDEAAARYEQVLVEAHARLPAPVVKD
jgi:hypothetical protein